MRVRARVSGVVQGVGFRPYVHGLATELGLSGFVLNDSRGVVLEVEGASVERFLARLRDEAPPLASIEALTFEPVPEVRRGGVLDPGQRRRAARRGDRARHRDVRRLPRGAVRPCGSPLPLPVHQLHQLRAAVHDRHGRPVRPAEHDDGGIRDVRGLPGRVRRPGRPPLPRAAERVPGVRPDRDARGRRRDVGGAGGAVGRTAAAAPPTRSPPPRPLAPPTRSPPPRPLAATDAVAAAAARCVAAPSSRSRVSAGTTSRVAPMTRTWSRGCGRANTARTARSR